MFLYFILFANIGLYCFYKIKNKDVNFLLPFGIAISFNSIFGFLVIPSINYLIGFITLSTIFAIYYIDAYLREKNNKEG
ncbi:MAG: hypothetical protein KN64_00980 [Sulfurovum sp. AS07-7]|nr:MAG: hypothetical protein KN64_00980 [Sulfurovum sp. AS07-7]